METAVTRIFDDLDEGTQAALILAADIGAQFGPLVKVSGYWLDAQDRRHGVHEAKELAAAALAGDDEDATDTHDMYERISLTLMGPHSQAVLTSDEFGARSDQWCVCGDGHGDTAYFERWGTVGRIAAGQVHAALRCRRFVPPSGDAR